MGSLNVKGIRERALKRQLEKFYNKIRYVEPDCLSTVGTWAMTLLIVESD